MDFIRRQLSGKAVASNSDVISRSGYLNEGNKVTPFYSHYY